MVGAALFWLAYSGAELHALEAGLRAQAQVIRGGLQAEGTSLAYMGGPSLPGQSSQGTVIGAVLLDPGGRVLLRSTDLPSVTAVEQAARGARGAGPTLLTASLDGQATRVLVTSVSVGGGRQALLVLTRSLANHDEKLLHAAGVLTATVIVLIALAAFSAHVLAGRVLTPVREITATARDLSQHDLNRRITLDLPPDELGELAATFNGMLERLESAFTSLHRFTADAAHELRTPLALMRSEIQVTLRGSESLEEHRATLESVLTDVERLTRTADQLLLLARVDSGVLAPRTDRVDVDDLLDEVVTRWRPTLLDRDIRLCVQLPGRGAISADRDMVHRLLDNLMDNAARHSGPGGSISLRGAVAARGVELTVRDSGPGVDPAVRDRIFERFTRADPARGRETGGAGLGLSICDAIARLHGGTIGLEDGGGGGSCFRVWLPSNGSEAPPGAI